MDPKTKFTVVFRKTRKKGKNKKSLRYKGSSFSAYAKFSKKLTFLIPWHAHVRVRIRGKRRYFFESFAYVLNKWSLKQSTEVRVVWTSPFPPLFKAYENSVKSFSVVSLFKHWFSDTSDAQELMKYKRNQYNPWSSLTFFPVVY